MAAAEFYTIGDFFTDRVIVNIKEEPRSWQHELATIRPHDLTLLSDCPLHEQAGTYLIVDQVILLVLLKSCQGVVNYSTTGNGRWSDFNGSHPALLGQTRLNDRPVPSVLGDSGYGVRWRFDDHVGRAIKQLCEVPHAVVGELLRRRHVTRVTARRASIDPAHNHVNLFTSERPVILEGLDADVRINVPRRHLSLNNPSLN